MLLRSSSTPVLGSLFSSFSDSPNNTSDHNKPPSDHLKKVSFSHSTQPNFHYFSYNSSPISHFKPEYSCHGGNGFRRARSDGNLQGLAPSDADDFHNSTPNRLPRPPSSVLQTIPSFSSCNSGRDEYEEEDEEVGEADDLIRSITIGENITAIGGRDFVPFDETGVGLIALEEKKEDGVFGNEVEAPPLFLARGLGIDSGNSMNFGSGCGGGGGSDFRHADSNEGGGEGSDMERYYQRMVEENPSNALFLRNYAQFLYQSKGNVARAEEYYSRAILAVPGDGEVLSQYAKLIWEHHHDRERASTYFEQAVQAAPENSHVLAEYAGFLWETEDEEGEGEGEGEEKNSGSQNCPLIPISHSATASASA